LVTFEAVRPKPAKTYVKKVGNFLEAREKLPKHPPLWEHAPSMETAS
jgi:hypothetical protein